MNVMRRLPPSRMRFQRALCTCCSASERIFEILDSEPEPPDPPDAVDAPEIRTGMEYQNLTFSYNTEPVLRNINLKVSPGEVVALVGRSGAGKSTMVDLLCRYYDPVGGRILLEGHDLRNIKRGSLRESLAVVAQ